ncbi:unnamed protein product [Pedinophyceae sp. YPF-701]|nr:unnamed protein product [Pedinophyceae sp. YPF-701]
MCRLPPSSTAARASGPAPHKRQRVALEEHFGAAGKGRAGDVTRLLSEEDPGCSCSGHRRKRACACGGHAVGGPSTSAPEVLHHGLRLAGKMAKAAGDAPSLKRPSVSQALLRRAMGRVHRERTREDFRVSCRSSMPQTWREKELDLEVLQRFDKAFTVRWVEPDVAYVGTKCNTLMQITPSTGKVVQVPLPAAPERNVSLQAPEANPFGHCGIHSIDASPCGGLLATGGREASDCVVLHRETMEPVTTLVGHLDWVFGIKFLSSTRLATCSRDHTIKVWDVSTDGSYDTYDPDAASRPPLVTRWDHQGKVRAMALAQGSRRLASLGCDGTVLIWDAARMQPSAGVQLPYRQENVCVAARDGLIACGSSSHVILMDPRAPQSTLFSVPTVDGSGGVRSLEFSDPLLSVGAGRGQVCFLDTRSMSFLPVNSAEHGAPLGAPADGPDSWGVHLGRGHVDTNAVFRQYFRNMHVFHACHAHAWDPAGTRMIAVGGPLAYGLRGCYVGVWQ